MSAKSPAIYLGIDPSGGRSLFTYVALDRDCKIEALGTGKLAAVLAYAAGQPSAFVLINGPAGVNLGLTDQADEQHALFPEPGGGSWTNMRLAEAQLLQRGLEATYTKTNVDDCSPWMRSSFELFRQLKQLGYQSYPQSEAVRLCSEVQARAAFSSLVEAPLFDGHALEGRLQRQMILNNEGLPVRDPMDFFEEVTRHRLLRGILPYELLYSSRELNAMMAAYTGWLAFSHPQRVHLLGDPNEGCLLLPVKEISPERLKTSTD